MYETYEQFEERMFQEFKKSMLDWKDIFWVKTPTYEGKGRRQTKRFAPSEKLEVRLYRTGDNDETTCEGATP